MGSADSAAADVAGAAPAFARRATVADVPEIVRLAVVMYLALEAPPPPPGGWEGWTAEAEAHLARRLDQDVVVFVVDDPDAPGHLVSCGAGTVWTRLPNAWYPADPRAGYVQWMSTEPEFRRRGLNRLVLRALLDWFDAEGIQLVELHASPMGAPLYRSEGFDEGGGWGVALRRRRNTG